MSRLFFGLLSVVGLALAGLVLSMGPASAGSGNFVSTWKTDNAGASSSNQITLPLYNSGTYNFSVDWGDNSGVQTVTSSSGGTHTYASAGTYTVTISGTITGWRFNGGGDKLKLLEISHWGPLNFGNYGGAFNGAAFLKVTATDVPDLTGVTDLSATFASCSSLTSVGGTWSTGSVTRMDFMFYLVRKWAWTTVAVVRGADQATGSRVTV